MKLRANLEKAEYQKNGFSTMLQKYKLLFKIMKILGSMKKISKKLNK
jgi:hypothetical protein